MRRLQKRRPDFDLSSAPGGSWNWLIGTLAAGLVTGVLVLATRKLMRRRRDEEPDADVDSGDSDEWQDRLDDELSELD